MKFLQPYKKSSQMLVRLTAEYDPLLVVATRWAGGGNVSERAHVMHDAGTTLATFKLDSCDVSYFNSASSLNSHVPSEVL